MLTILVNQEKLLINVNNSISSTNIAAVIEQVGLHSVTTVSIHKNG